MTFFDNPVEIVSKGEKAALTDQDGAWQSLAEAERIEGPGQHALLVRNFRIPAKGRQLAGFAKELKKDGDVYSSDLTEEGAKAFLTFRRGMNGGDAPTVSNAKGSVSSGSKTARSRSTIQSQRQRELERK